jgi:prepilin peptidase CpaA
MGDWSLQQLVFAVAVGFFSLTAAWWDCRTHRVPNWLTVPMFLAGWGYQFAFAGWGGVGEAALAFALGFGTLFLLWVIGSGGGGDVKLMGALAVWLGLRMTILVMVVSSTLVLVGTVVLVFGHVVKSVFRRSPEAAAVPAPGTRPRRRVMAYAIPVAFATWAVMVFELPPM